jgi:hypothetical protein
VIENIVQDLCFFVMSGSSKVEMLSFEFFDGVLYWTWICVSESSFFGSIRKNVFPGEEPFFQFFIFF